MSVHETLRCLEILLFVSSTVAQDTWKCGAFKFETPNIINGELLVKEESQINITFAILAGNCSNVTYGDIDIFKIENTSTGIMNVPQCKRCCNCSNNLVQSKTICSCLHLPGLYSFSFIAQKTDSAVWVWRTVGIPDATIKINVTYRPSVTHLKIVGYETYIPRSTSSVTVVCSWVNGNPPTKARLMDRHNNVLEIGDKSGNVSYTFKSVTCNNAGVVRCEADGSDRNMSSTMLIECKSKRPPEFVRTPYTSYITKSVTVGQSAEFTFEFRSHSPNISSCHINHKHKPVDSDQFLTDLDNCTEAVRYGSTCSFNSEHNHCQYCVTGKPPDLQLTLHVSDVKRNDDGNWTVTISNDKGSDVMDFHISINLGSVPADVQTKVVQVAVISGVTSITVIVVITVFCIIKGKGTYARLKRRQKQETVLHRGLGTDNGDNSQRLSGIYYEIQDTHLETDLQPKLPKLSVGVNDFPPQNYLHPVESTSDIQLKSVDCLQIAQEETGSNAFAKKSECVELQNPASSSQNASDYLKPIPSESQTSNVVPMSDYLEPVQTESGIISKQKRSEYLKLDQTGNQTRSGQQSSDYLKLFQKDHDTNKEQQRSECLEYLKLQTENQTDSGQQRPEYLKLVQTGNQTDSGQQRPEYLKLVQTGNQTDSGQQRPEYLKLVQTGNQTDSGQQRP